MLDLDVHSKHIVLIRNIQYMYKWNIEEIVNVQIGGCTPIYCNIFISHDNFLHNTQRIDTIIIDTINDDPDNNIGSDVAYEVCYWNRRYQKEHDTNLMISKDVHYLIRWVEQYVLTKPAINRTLNRLFDNQTYPSGSNIFGPILTSNDIKMMIHDYQNLDNDWL